MLNSGLVWNRGLVAIVAVALLAGCGPGSSGPEPTPSPPPVSAINFCELIDLDDATEVAARLGVLEWAGTPTAPMRVSWRTVDLMTLPESERCWYGYQLGDRGFVLHAYPAGGIPDPPEDAEPVSELGEGAYFQAGLDRQFALAAPASDAFLVLSGQFGRDTDAASAREGLSRLLLPAIDRVGPGAELARLDAGEDCAELADPAAVALGVTPEFSRHTEVDGWYSCDFAAVSTGRTASASVERGAAEHRRAGAADAGGPLLWRELDSLPDAWISDASGAILVLAGNDAAIVVVQHHNDRTTSGPEIIEEFAAAVVAVLAG